MKKTIIGGLVVAVVSAFVLSPASNILFPKNEAEAGKNDSIDRKNTANQGSGVVTVESGDGSQIVVGENNTVIEENHGLITINPPLEKKQVKPEPEFGNGGIISDVIVNVPRSTADGKDWDSDGSPPDLAICIQSPHKKNQKCYPKSPVGAGVIALSKCKNSYKCTFSNVTLDTNDLEIAVINMNWRESEIISVGTCKVSDGCKISGTSIQFDWLPYSN
ncbi:hypothetical protein AAOGI_32420 [Agarivorans albus]